MVKLVLSHNDMYHDEEHQAVQAVVFTAEIVVAISALNLAVVD